MEKANANFFNRSRKRKQIRKDKAIVDFKQWTQEVSDNLEKLQGQEKESLEGQMDRRLDEYFQTILNNNYMLDSDLIAFIKNLQLDCLLKRNNFTTNMFANFERLLEPKQEIGLPSKNTDNIQGEKQVNSKGALDITSKTIKNVEIEMADTEPIFKEDITQNIAELVDPIVLPRPFISDRRFGNKPPLKDTINPQLNYD